MLLLLILGSSERNKGQIEKERLLDPDYIEMDVRGVKFLVSLTPIEDKSLEELRRRFETEGEYRYASWSDEEALGFGARRVKLKMGLGATMIYIDLLLFANRIVRYELGADVSKQQWRDNSEKLIEAWKDGGGPPFTQIGTKLIYEKEFPNVRAAYYAQVERQLGPIKPALIPQNLKSAYALLINPLENSRISMVACDEGKPAIDALEDAKRIDLIENVLRGYNPGGRIYAAISLLRMKRSGKKFSRATKSAIAKVVALNADTGTCRGHTGINGLKARDIVPEYVKSVEWNLLRR